MHTGHSCCLQNFTWIVGTSGGLIFNNMAVFSFNSLIFFLAWNRMLIWHIKFGIFEGLLDPSWGFFPSTYWGGWAQITLPHLQILSYILCTHNICKFFWPMTLMHILFFQIFKEKSFDAECSLLLEECEHCLCNLRAVLYFSRGVKVFKL